jgi:predicted Rossmann fold nucleotide-binding protein DprA/Smf involved in DNA uptake
MGSPLLFRAHKTLIEPEQIPISFMPPSALLTYKDQITDSFIQALRDKKNFEDEWKEKERQLRELKAKKKPKKKQVVEEVKKSVSDIEELSQESERSIFIWEEDNTLVDVQSP